MVLFYLSFYNVSTLADMEMILVISMSMTHMWGHLNGRSCSSVLKLRFILNHFLFVSISLLHRSLSCKNGLSISKACVDIVIETM